MKIGMSEILSAIEDAAAKKITRELAKEGFFVKRGYFPSEGNEIQFDLYAERGKDRRVYELKLGKNKIQSKQFVRLQAEARRLEAKLYIVYLETPRSKEIDFEGLEEIIYEDLVNDLPSELDSLSTHTTIEDVDNVEISVIRISDGIAILEGSGTINVCLQFGSNSDLRKNDGVEDVDSVDFFFKLSIDMSSCKIEKRYYKIDISQSK